MNRFRMVTITFLIATSMPAACSKPCDKVFAKLADCHKGKGTPSQEEKSKFIAECKRDADPAKIKRCLDASCKDLLTCLKKARKSQRAGASPEQAKQHVRSLGKSICAYYARKKTLPPGAGPTPPPGACCKQGGLCKDAAVWDHGTWKSLKFRIAEPHAYSYSYVPAPDGKSFTLTARGDRDCNGTSAEFMLQGQLRSGVMVVGAMFIQNEKE